MKSFNEESLVNNLQFWLEPYLDNIRTIKALESLDIYSILLGLIPWEQQQNLGTLVPTHIEVPSGSRIKIDYSNIEVPILAVRLQEMFGLHETPKIVKFLFKYIY